MKLYYAPGTCSLSPHIALREAELDFELVKTDNKTKKLPDGGDYRSVNPKGYVPCLELDNGERLTEGPAIVQYIADQVPTKRLAPLAGTFERYRLQEWLNYITSELHKSYSPLFMPTTPEDYKPVARERLAMRYELIEATLAKQPYLLPSGFSVADPYLFAVTNWALRVQLNLDPFQAVRAFQGRMRERPAVQAALKAEGLA
jgi:glutathione S-transferase